MMNKQIKPLPILQGKTAFAINLISQVSVIVAQMVISLFLTPIVLDKMGAEAYGFVGLVNNFVSYMAVITTALNSLAGRYITIAHHSGDQESAESYYSSVFFANCVMAVAVLAGSVLLAANIESVVSVSPGLVEDLQLMILLAFFNCALSLVVVVFGIAAFIKNQLYLNSIAQLVSSVIRAMLLCILFLTVAPHMWYYSAAAVVASVAFLALQIWTTRRIAPEYRVKATCFSIQRVLEILKSGLWVSIESINKLLLTGLDLWISNLFVGAYQMGILSVAKTIPNALLSVSNSLSSLFYPKCAELYAKKKTDELVKQFGFAMRFTAAVMIVPLAGFVAYGLHFYELWLPGRDVSELLLIQRLSVLTVVSLLASALVEPLYYANTLTNKIKGSVLITLGFSLLVFAIELSLLLFTELEGLFVIASVSSVVMTFRHCFVQPVYAAHVLGLRGSSFYKPLGKEAVGLFVVLATFAILSKALPFSSWACFLISCLISAAIGYTELSLLLLDREERRKAFGMLLVRRR